MYLIFFFMKILSITFAAYTQIALQTSFNLFLFDLILNILSTIFQLNRDGSSWVEPVLS